MIELVFAIVVIAISVISLPMMMQTTSKGIESNIVQEAIFATGAILNESTSFYWDKHSIDDANVSNGYSRVVNTGGCLLTGASYKRVGHINRQCLDNNATSPDALGDNSSIEWAENIYNNTQILTGAASAASYKESYSATATVTTCKTGNTFTQFGLEANNPNLKEIELKITKTGSADTLILLRAYTANIGEVAPESKVL